MADLADVRSRLESIDAELADVAMDLLRRAIEDSDPQLAKQEKQVTRARRAIEKAVSTLQDPD